MAFRYWGGLLPELRDEINRVSINSNLQPDRCNRRSPRDQRDGGSYTRKSQTRKQAKFQCRSNSRKLTDDTWNCKQSWPPWDNVPQLKVGQRLTNQAKNQTELQLHPRPSRWIQALLQYTEQRPTSAHQAQCTDINCSKTNTASATVPQRTKEGCPGYWRAI